MDDDALMVSAEPDELVSELPVYLTHELAESLAVLQYPMRRTDRPYDADTGHMSRARAKPVQQALEVEFEVTVDGIHANYYDLDRDPEFSTVKVKSHRVEPKASYAIAVVKDGELHLTPIKSLLRMVPDFSRVDHLDEEEAAMMRPVEAPQAEGADAPKPVFVKAIRARKDTSSKETYVMLQQQREAESWIDLPVHDELSAPSEIARSKLTATHQAPIAWNLSSQEYVSQLCSVETGCENVPRLSLEDKIIEAVGNAGVLKYEDVCRVVENDSSAVIGLLQSTCILVQNCWVLKSSVSQSGRAGHARDYIIGCFGETRIVKSSSVSALVKVDLETLTKILGELALFDNQAKEWNFKEDNDDSFALAFPAVVQQQKILLRNLKASSLSALNPKASSFSSPIHAFKAAPARSPAFLSGESSNHVAESLAHLFDELFNEHGVCSKSYMWNILKHRASLDEESALNQVDEVTFANTLSSFGKRITGEKYCRASFRNPEVDSLRDCVISLFAREPEKAHRKAEINKYVQACTNSQLSQQHYERFCKEIASSSRSGTWVLKPGDYDANPVHKST